MAAVVTDTTTPSQMAAALRRAGFSAPLIPVMVAIGLAESGGKIRATHRNHNGSTDYGVWQINSVHGFSVDNLLTLDGNATAAKVVYDKQGLRAWATYNSGAYSSHMADAQKVSSNGDAPVVENFANPLSSAIAPIAWLLKVGQIFTSGDFWRRFGIVLLGIGLLGTALVVFVRSQIGDVRL